MNKIFIILFVSFCNLFLITNSSLTEENKVKIGLLVPLSGNNADIGKQIVKATRLALKDINSNKLEIFLKDTGSDPNKTLMSSKELQDLGVSLIIGPVFHENLLYLDQAKDLIFLSFTNKTLSLPKNVISTGINSTSQLNTIKKFIKQNELSVSDFLEFSRKVVKPDKFLPKPLYISPSQSLFAKYKGPKILDKPLDVS